MEGEVKERRKIQFSVPSAVPTQLDPKQVELIRRRRPTPATLFRLTDHPSPEEDNPSHQLAVCENGVLKAKRVNTAVYQPPSIKAVQKMVEAHMQSSEPGHGSPSSESSDNEEASPDPDGDPPEDTTSDKSERHSVCEVTDEDTGSTLLHNVPGEDDEGPAESKDGKNRDEESAAVNFPSVQEIQVEMPSSTADADSACSKSTEDEVKTPNSVRDSPEDQSELHSAAEITGSIPLLNVPAEDNEGTAESKEGLDTSVEDTDNGESKEKEAD